MLPPPPALIADKSEESDVDIYRVYIGGMSALKISARLAEVQFGVLFAMRSLCQLAYNDEAYWNLRCLLDRAAIHVHRAKWLTGRATGLMIGVEPATHADSDVAAGLAEADRANEIASYVTAALDGRPHAPPQIAELQLEKRGTEILYADGIPIVPSICPIITIQGSSYEMGRQYAKQIIDVFGPFVFSRYASQRFTRDEFTTLERWEKELAQYAPEIIEMARGWADGATEAGLPMRYENVLTLWTTDMPPARSPEGMMDSASALFGAAYAGLSARTAYLAANILSDASDLCSGVCAWGRAAANQHVVAAASTDHDCWFQATVVAYPDTGNPFIFTPFSVNGWLPGLGNTTMAGMPGVNAKGLALVHHGGDPKMVEPPETWGWGIRKGAAIFHILRYADTADQAREMEMSWPIGDVGRMMGAPGALWADARGAHVAESRHRSNAMPEGIVRTNSIDADGSAHYFLYATNNALHPASRRSNGGGVDGLNWCAGGGWHTTSPEVIGAGKTVQDSFARWASRHSASRNLFFMHHLREAEGAIDISWLERLYRSPGEYPLPQEWKTRMAAYKAGENLACSPAHRGNAFTVLIEPGADGGPLYMGCVGPARRDLPPRDDSHGFHYHDETNAFWQLQLGPDLLATIRAAESCAQHLISNAKHLRNSLEKNHAASETLDQWLTEAEVHFSQGQAARLDGADKSQDSTVARHGIALRAFTRAHVRAQQIINIVQPPTGLDAK